ncbi:MAG: TetR/AcrR family transcriptional regulator [Eubacterium sp.]|nr:TetR/AcrR family transcriptional regulator [Eubacterium sp.]
MSRKEQKEERRKAILMAALQLFVERGYHETKIADIAKAVSMSVGLMFHYFESKEALLIELVKMGAEGTKSAKIPENVPMDMFLGGFLRELFDYAEKEPWVFNMFILMGQARRAGMPEEARKIAFSVDGIGADTAEGIALGQKAGIFREGDPEALARIFWASVQGVMEEMAVNRELEAPEPEWLIGILRK